MDQKATNLGSYDFPSLLTEPSQGPKGVEDSSDSENIVERAKRRPKFRSLSPLLYDERPPRWYEKTPNQLLIGMCICIGLIMFGLAVLPHDYHRKWVKNLKEMGLYGDIQTLQDHGVLEFNRRTVYGRPLEPWQLDTSREYHLSRNGLWDVDQEPTTREYTFNITDVMARPDGVAKEMTLINDKFPGPVIEANEGDKLVVHVNNHGKRPTAIHFHGLHQHGTMSMDGAVGVTQCAILPGENYTLEFTLNQYGTYWYHAHLATQLLEGLAGPVVIHSKREREAYQYDEEMVVFMSDLYHENSFELLKKYIAPGVENAEPVPDAGLIQGLGQSDCLKFADKNCTNSSAAVVPVLNDKVYRLRLVSAGGFSEFDFSIDGHEMEVIETDGTNTEPYKLGVLRLSNAQRYSVLVKMDRKSGSYWLRATMNTYCYDADSSHLDTDVKAVLSYPDATREILANGGVAANEPTSEKNQDLSGSISCVELDAKLLKPKFDTQFPDKPDQLMQLDASFQIGGRQISLGYLNDTSYKRLKSPQDNTLKKILAMDDDEAARQLTGKNQNPAWAENQFIVTVPSAQVVDLVINNYDDGSHPFHLHGHKFWVLDGGKGYFDYDRYRNMTLDSPIQRDTVQVDKFGWALIRIRMDNPGIWLFHCHVAWHMAAGMMSQFLVMPQQLRHQQPPQQWWDLCAKN